MAIRPHNPVIYYNLGNAYDKNESIANAITAYQKTIDIDPSYIDAYVNLGALLAQQGRFEEAREIWRRGLKINHDELDIKRNLEKLDRLQKNNPAL